MNLTKEEENKLIEILKNNKSLMLILEKTCNLGFKDWYVGAGAVSQTVWNVMHGFDPEYGIEDYDVVYYDKDISSKAENFYIQKSKKMFKGFNINIEITNQARVHLWFEKYFGYRIKQHKSTENAIGTWPTTASCVALRFSEKTNQYKIFAPYGLDDLFNLVVRANKKTITKEVYLKKINKWSKKWPNLNIVSWDEV